jgi:bifunctional non-homologous end joining protein LigD
MGDRLEEYRRRRDARRTPEPVPEGPLPTGDDDTFVIQQHHARALHWDLRLERNGVLVSWALPRGVPHDPKDNHLAVHTEDHPLEYADFAGEIPAGEYGGGRVYLFDRGRYATEKWRDDEVVVVFDGTRVRGRYVLFQTNGKNWMIHRMDPPEPSWTPMPDPVPMAARPAERLPAGRGWGYELEWPGRRAIGSVSGGRLRLVAGKKDITSEYPEVRPLGDRLAPTECVLDGVLVAFDANGQVSRTALQHKTPVQYLIFDLLWLDGRTLLDLPYRERRDLLDGLDLTGAHWQTPPYFPTGGRQALQTARAQGLPGVVAKRLASTYRPGEGDGSWVAVAAGNG